MSTSSAKRGRNSPRSRLGCLACKQRHIRCDEAIPKCGRCARSQIECRYVAQPKGRTVAVRKGPPRLLLPCPEPATSSPGLSSTSSSFKREGGQSSADGELEAEPERECDPFRRQTQMSFFGDESAYVLHGLEWDWPTRCGGGEMGIEAADYNLPLVGDQSWTWPDSFCHQREGSEIISPILTTSDLARSSELSTACVGGQPSQLECRLKVFMKIRQPPAAMLMGGIAKWRRLQAYMVKLGSKDELVQEALLCLEEVLVEQPATGSSMTPGDPNETPARFEALKSRVIVAISHSEHRRPREMLAALYLLAWAQVISLKKPGFGDTAFLREQLDAVIVDSQCEWDRYSRQLLSAFNSLDTKATHLGGCPILSPKALAVVSRYPIQITDYGYDESHALRPEESTAVSRAAAAAAGYSEPFGPGRAAAAQLSIVSLKEIVLKSVLQPGAEWYLRHQVYFRHISSLDKHQRPRFTPEDELDVSLRGRQIQLELESLWDERPAIVSLTAGELSRTVAPDVAVRMQEVSSVYLASYWILFVYLHRVCWWHLPHTAAVKSALAETWKHFQTGYYEEQGPVRTVHPALMWPVFIYAIECSDEGQQKWSVEQIKQLAIPRGVVESDDKAVDVLPALRLSQGATQNASRAGALLESLIRKQKATGARVDIRDMAVSMFGCYFSIV